VELRRFRIDRDGPADQLYGHFGVALLILEQSQVMQCGGVIRIGGQYLAEEFLGLGGPAGLMQSHRVLIELVNRHGGILGFGAPAPPDIAIG
jgi:hypothetical protein